MVTRVKQFNRDGVVVTCLKGESVGFCDFRSFKLFLNPFLGLFKRPDKQPLYNTKREKVFAACTVPMRKPGPLVPVTAKVPPNAEPMLEEIAAISSSACIVLIPKFLY